MRGSKKMIRALTLALTAAIFLSIVSMASAAEIKPLRLYRNVEPICQANSKANEKLLKPVKKEVKNGKWRSGGQAARPGSQGSEDHRG